MKEDRKGKEILQLPEEHHTRWRGTDTYLLHGQNDTKKTTNWALILHGQNNTKKMIAV